MKFSAVVLCLIPALASAFAPGVQVSITGFWYEPTSLRFNFCRWRAPFPHNPELILKPSSLTLLFCNNSFVEIAKQNSLKVAPGLATVPQFSTPAYNVATTKSASALQMSVSRLIMT